MNNIQNVSIVNGGAFGINGLLSTPNIYAHNFGYFYIKKIICNKYTNPTFGDKPDVWRIAINNGYYNSYFYSKGKYGDNGIDVNEPVTSGIIIDTSTMQTTGTTFCSIEYSRGPFLDFYYSYGLEILFFIIVCISFIMGFIKGKLNF